MPHQSQYPLTHGRFPKRAKAMLIPTPLRTINSFSLRDGTPAVNLTRSVPHGVAADILLLNCRHVGHLLYTAYAERGLRRCSHLSLSCFAQRLLTAQLCT